MLKIEENFGNSNNFEDNVPYYLKIKQVSFPILDYEYKNENCHN